MKKLICCLIVSSVVDVCMAQQTIVSLGEPLTAVGQIVDGGQYVLRNVGRNNYLYESPYTTLFMSGMPTFGTDSSMDYVITVGCDADGKYTFQTRRGRYIPEVPDGRPYTVGKAEGAGHFVVEKAANGHFTIVNSVNTAYGFDATASDFVGWNAKQGANCFYAIYPAETGAINYPLESYQEPDDSSEADIEAWSALENQSKIYVSWASKDVHYKKREVPALKMQSEHTVTAWRGERLGIEAVIFSAKGSVGNLSLSLSSWRDSETGEVVVPAEHGEVGFMRYVLTDDYRACRDHDYSLEPWLVADVIDGDGGAMALEARTTRPVWCTLEVPRDIPSGCYVVTLGITDSATGLVDSLKLNVNVDGRTLPLPSDQRFHLDLWQQPYSVSRYHGVERWSEEHFAALRPYMRSLARAGQKVVSTFLFFEPWGDQSNDKFDPMVQVIKCADGTWKYDYSVFDRYVKLMEECGIDRQINCFSMIPWDMNFRYMDEATDSYRFLNAQTTSDEYRELWRSFLTDFAAHLKKCGWFDKTCMSMDERGLSSMLDAYNLVQETVPGMKMALAGSFHVELVDKLYDYCVNYGARFSEKELSARKAAGHITTLYTSCSDVMPNIYSNSDPADAAYLPLHAVANDFDGYLHWSWLNWTEQPLLDTRFRLFGAGDTYAFYPGNRSSVRFERLIEGIQLAEKIYMLRDEYAAAGNDNALLKIESALRQFKSGNISATRTSASLVSRLHAAVNDLYGPASLPEDMVEGMDSLVRWNGSRMTADEPVTVYVYDFSGSLIEQSEKVTSFELVNYSPGNYVIKAVSSGGKCYTYKLRHALLL